MQLCSIALKLIEVADTKVTDFSFLTIIILVSVAMEVKGKRILVLGALFMVILLSSQQNTAEAFDLGKFFKKWCVSTCGDLCDLKPKDLCKVLCTTICDLVLSKNGQVALSGVPSINMNCSWGCVQKNCSTVTAKENLNGCFGSCCGM